MRINHLTSSAFEILHHAAKEDGVGFVFPPASNALAGTEAVPFASHHLLPKSTLFEGDLKNIPDRPRFESQAPL